MNFIKRTLCAMAFFASATVVGADRVIVPIEKSGDTVADNLLNMRRRLLTAKRDNPGKVVELRSFDAPEAVTSEIRRFVDGTNVVWGDIFMELLFPFAVAGISTSLTAKAKRISAQP